MFVEVTSNDVKYFQKKLMAWGRDNYVDFPWRHTSNRWHNLVAEIMLQRTRAEQVVPVFEDFCKNYPDPADYYDDPDTTVFKTLGLPVREKTLKDLSKILINTMIPSEREALLNLPGVGDYIAAAYRSLHLNLPDTIIDSNVVRIYGRFFGFITNAETRRKKEFIEMATLLTPKRQFRKYNYGLIDFTRAICKPVPICDQCPIQRKCKEIANKHSFFG